MVRIKFLNNTARNEAIQMVWDRERIEIYSPSELGFSDDAAQAIQRRYRDCDIKIIRRERRPVKPY